MSRFAPDVTDSNFEEVVLQSNRPVLVNFWAEWCKECRPMAQTIDAVADEYIGRATVVNLNVDENPEMARRYGISSIPTVILFNAGRMGERILGVTSKGHLSRTIDKLESSTNDTANKESPQDNGRAHMKSPYEVLNVLEGATREEISIAYKQMAKLYHPDKVDHLAPEFKALAEIRMKEINLAYQALMG